MMRGQVRWLVAASLVAVLVLTVGCSRAAQSPSSTSTSGSASATPTTPADKATAARDRAAALAVLKTAFEKRVSEPVTFASAEVKLYGHFAIADVEAVKPDGKQIDWATLSEFAPAFEEGAFDSRSEALLRKTNGQWEVVELRVGPTDTKRGEWIEAYDLTSTDSAQ